MKDLDFFETVVESIKSRKEGNLVTKVMLIVFLPIWMVTTSKEPLKVKLFLEIFALIIFSIYFIFLLIIFPLLLLASIFLELRDITFKKMLSFLPNMLLITAGLVVELVVMIFAFANAVDQLFE